MTMSDSAYDTLTAALAAYDAGLCVVRAAVDGTKRPDGQWKHYQSQRPTREVVASWFADGHPGMGVICGAVSGDLEMLELEGRFMDDDGGARFTRACRDAGLELLLKRLANGLHTISPSGGRHFLYRVDGPIDGNTKLARRPSTPDELATNPDNPVQTLIETRGEGGFVVLAPSHGPTHPTGKPWATKAGDFASIPTITPAERDALFAVARSFDEAVALPKPTPPPPTRRVQPQRWAGQAIGESWMDAVVEHLAATVDVRDVLKAHGWEYCYTDAHGRRLMRRPGKDQGVSGSINAAGRLLPFSTSVPFDVGGTPSTTYDTLDVIAVYEHGGDRSAAARHVADHTGIYAAWKARDAPQALANVIAPRTPPPNVDPATGEIRSCGTLGDEFWTARPVLAQIRDAARSRLVAPSAVLGAVLARVAAFTPPSTCLPPLVGSTAPLSLYVALRGNSGAGKSTPAAAAADLLPETPAGCVGPLALGSGEGLVEAYMEMVEEVGSDDKKRKVKRQVHHGALFSLDEGQVLAELGARRGATILPMLRTAWSGGYTGQANASVETRRNLNAGSYVVGLVSLWQDYAAAALLDDAPGGTPQRFVWLNTVDTDAPDEVPPWPGPLAWEPPPKYTVKVPLEVAPPVVREITAARRAVLRGVSTVAPLDGHRDLNRLKVAGVLGVLDDRRDISTGDWRLAGMILDASDVVRDRILSEHRRTAAEREMAGHRKAATREQVIAQAAHERALERAARAVAKRVWRGDGAELLRRDLRHAIRHDVRQEVSVDEAIEEAERLLWITPKGEGFVPGSARPA